jgi:hypothetical protein
MPRIKLPVCEFPVMKSHCITFPFREVNGKWQNVELANQVISRTLFQGHQICHITETDNREPQTRCKGAYEHNYEIYKRLNLVHLLK